MKNSPVLWWNTKPFKICLGNGKNDSICKFYGRRKVKCTHCFGGKPVEQLEGN